MNTLDIYVREQGGAYVTNRMRGVSSSATMSAEAAAQRQAEKLFGPALQSVKLVEQMNRASTFRVVADADHLAWCWATGLIEFGGVPPRDAVVFAVGPRRALERQVAAAARHGYKGELLVPGIPEAKSQRAGMDALLAFVRWRASKNGKANAHFVAFGTDIEPAEA